MQAVNWMFTMRHLLCQKYALNGLKSSQKVDQEALSQTLSEIELAATNINQSLGQVSDDTPGSDRRRLASSMPSRRLTCSISRIMTACSCRHSPRALLETFAKESPMIAISRFNMMTICSGLGEGFGFKSGLE